MYKIELIVASTIKDRLSKIESKLNEMVALGYELVTMSGTIETILVFKKI